ncbi:hypothetical protein AKO1_012573 [Acrasis kona]|uniref:DUF3592 domain-containing protein n=1 Tax=Acrasis kona TaxID=1008807 RepID=A0AAW2YMH5_9EUKA
MIRGLNRVGNYVATRRHLSIWPRDFMKKVASNNRKNTYKDDTYSDHATIMVLSGVFALGTGFALYTTYLRVSEYAESHSWPTVTGVITGATHGRRTVNDILYKYRVGNQYYKSFSISRRILPPFGADPEDIEVQVRIGQEVLVYYNPKRPQAACLVPTKGINYSDVLLCGLLALITAKAATMWVARVTYMVKHKLNTRRR